MAWGKWGILLLLSILLVFLLQVVIMSVAVTVLRSVSVVDSRPVL